MVEPLEYQKDTCSYCALLEVGADTALLVYSDFNYPDGRGIPAATHPFEGRPTSSRLLSFPRSVSEEQGSPTSYLLDDLAGWMSGACGEG